MTKFKSIAIIVVCLGLCGCGSGNDTANGQPSATSADKMSSNVEKNSAFDHVASKEVGFNWVDMSQPGRQGLHMLKHVVTCRVPTEQDPSLELEAYESEDKNGPWLKISGTMQESTFSAHIGNGKTFEVVGPFMEGDGWTSEKPNFLLGMKPAEGSAAEKPLDFIGYFECE